MNSTIIAIPSSHPGGLDAALGAHFGHCDLYTLVKIADGKIEEIATLPNVPHQQGGCMAPVNHLAQNGVKVLIAGGMGRGAYERFRSLGIRPIVTELPDVDAAALASAAGTLVDHTEQLH